MPEVKTKEDVKSLLANKKSGVNKPVLFATEIEALKKGEGLLISLEEFPLKTYMITFPYFSASKIKI